MLVMLLLIMLMILVQRSAGGGDDDDDDDPDHDRAGDACTTLLLIMLMMMLMMILMLIVVVVVTQVCRLDDRSHPTVAVAALFGGRRSQHSPHLPPGDPLSPQQFNAEQWRKAPAPALQPAPAPAPAEGPVPIPAPPEAAGWEHGLHFLRAGRKSASCCCCCYCCTHMSHRITSHKHADGRGRHQGAPYGRKPKPPL